MLNFISPIKENYSYNNFSMKEKTPVTKINLRGNLVDKEFTNKVEKILGIILPQESCSTSIKENISCPIYFVTGNHEYYLKDSNTKIKEINNYGINHICNNNIEVNNINLIGIDDNISK